MGDRIVNSELWMQDAMCRDEGLADLFFHEDGERGFAKDARDRRAKAVCNMCPVVSDCLEYVLEHKEPYGVWGGLSEDDRKRMNSPLSVAL